MRAPEYMRACIKDPLSLTMMHRGHSAESWTTKPQLLVNFANLRRIPVLRLVYFGFRSCRSIFEVYSFRSSPFAMFLKYSFKIYYV